MYGYKLFLYLWGMLRYRRGCKSKIFAIVKCIMFDKIEPTLVWDVAYLNKSRLTLSC